MAIFHMATNSPTKAEVIANWIPTQPWGPSTDAMVTLVGSFHFDDPEGRVGMQTHLVDAGGTLLQVPLTYRDTPLDSAEDALIGQMEHSVLGTRWVYDGLGDARFVTVLAGVTMTGQGQALGMARYDDRWYVAPSDVKLEGGGWSHEAAPIDGFVADPDHTNDVVFRSDHFALTVFRQPVPGSRPPIGLTATWDEQPDPVVLAEIREL